MFRTLRARAILSHVLPLALVALLTSVALLAAMENQVALPETQRLQLRLLGAAIAAAGVVLGSGLGLALGVNLEAALRRISQAVSQVAEGRPPEPLPESGPEELAQLAHAINQLEQHRRLLEEGRQRLLDNLVHELGRPLGALQSALQALQGGAHADEALRDELLSGMDGQLRRLNRLVDDLAGLHRQVVGSLELARRPVPAEQWLLPMLAVWREAAAAKGQRWQATLPARLPVVEVDPDRISQALGNLLSNAVKYTPANGAVTVEAGETGEALWIRVSDSGPGIPADQQAKIFEPFYREPGKRFAHGMGLGLSIARDLISAHGGRLELESAPGSGSQFTIWLPSKKSLDQ